VGEWCLCDQNGEAFGPEGCCQATMRRMYADRRCRGVKIYIHACREIGVEELLGAWRADSKDRIGGARAASQD
jgi:hypothetical protein